LKYCPLLADGKLKMIGQRGYSLIQHKRLLQHFGLRTIN